MARRSLRPELNRIRAWVRQGRTDAWIAHQLEVTVQQIQAFKREQDLAPGEETEGAATFSDFDDEIDLRAEDDALIAAELDAAQAESADADSDASDQDDDHDHEDCRTHISSSSKRCWRGLMSNVGEGWPGECWGSCSAPKRPG